MSDTNEQKKNTKDSYKLYAFVCMLLLNFYIDGVLLVSYFSWIGLIAVFVIIVLFVFLAGNDNNTEIIPMSARCIDFYLLNITLATLYKLLDIIASVKLFIDEISDGWNGVSILFMLGVVILLITGSRVVLAMLGLCIAYYLFDSLWPYGDQYLVVFAAAVSVLFLLQDIAEKSVMFEQKSEDRVKIKAHSRLHFFVFLVLAILWGIHMRVHINTFDWTCMTDIADVIWSNWIWIPTVCTVLGFVLWGIGALKSAGIQKLPLINDMYNCTCLLMVYIMLGFMLRTYTILNVFLLLFFVIYSFIHVKKKVQNYLDCCEYFFRTICLFVLIVLVVLMGGNGLYLNVAVTLVLAFSFRKSFIEWRKQNKLERCNVRFVREVINQAWRSLRNMSSWIKGVAVVSFEFIAFEGTRCISGNDYVHVFNMGMPDIKTIYVYVLLAGFTLIAYLILYKKNPMECAPTVTKCALVFITFLVASVVLINSSSRAVDMRYDSEKSVYKIYVEKRGNEKYDLTVKIGDQTSELKKSSDANKKYDIYEIPVVMEIDGSDMEYISAHIVNEDGTGSLYSAWNPALLIYMFECER